MRLQNSVCVNCLAGYPWECLRPNKDGHATCVLFVSPISAAVTASNKERGGQKKSKEKVTDLESTGRKRAAELYPIEEGLPCEWRYLKYAGGGPIPIVGCKDGLASNRHHGPDKNTLANQMGNVHRICATCHNRYHAANDAYYDSKRPSGGTAWLPVGTLIPHDTQERATELDIIQNEIFWRTKH